MTEFAQATLYGLLQGGLLALVAVGFALVWGVMNVVNLAHGAFVLCGAYLASALFFGLLNIGMGIMSIPIDYQFMVKALVLLVAVFFDVRGKRRTA